jgi:hypothetical protein
MKGSKLVSSTNLYFFHCAGGFDVDASLKVGRDYMHSPVSFHLPDGRVVDLFVGLRVVNPDGSEEYLHKTEDFERLGFYDQAYEALEFIPDDVENEDFEETFVRGSVKEFLDLTDEEMEKIEQRIKEDKEKGAI